MKKPFVALLLLVGAAAMVANLAFAQSENSQIGEKIVNAKMVREMLSTRAAKLRVSAPGSADTTYIGKSYTNHVAADNYWNIYTGDYLPGVVDPANSLWDFDNSVGLQAPDSLHGWWPIRRQYNSTGGLTLTDDQRTWWALDHGNIANYVINERRDGSGTSPGDRTFGVVGI